MGYYSWGGPPYGGTNMDFIGSALNISYHPRIMNFATTNGVICDKNGNLLFSSNGIFVANAQNDTMLNGNGLNPAYYTSHYDSIGLGIPQANLIIPFPADTTKYYLFHETVDDYSISNCALKLYYSVINMTLDSGRGAVIQKNVVLLNDSLVPGRLSACKHANGRDWWIISHQYNTDLYYKYLITPSGIQGPYQQNIGAIRKFYWGQIVFSPDGNKFACYAPYCGGLDIFDFDRCTGDFNLKAHIDINDSATAGGAAFSPNSQVLYVSSESYVYQFDMNAANVDSSKTTVAVFDGFSHPSGFYTSFYLSELAPDGKIYISCGDGTDYMHVINYPDSLGLSCNVCQHCIHLPAYNAFTIANHPNYFLGWENGSPCDSLPHVGITELAESNKIMVYPNPVTTEDITFTYPSRSEASVIAVFSTEGKEVVSYGLPQWSSVQHVKLPKLAKGVYLARLLTPNSKLQTPNIKFLVQ